MPAFRLAVPVLLFLAAGGLIAQPPNDDCSDAVALCAEQAVAGNNTGAMGALPGFCAGTGLGVWYSFTTNSVGGAVDITVDGIQCPDIAGMDHEMGVVVLAGDGSCTPGSFNAVSGCDEQDSVSFTATTSPLQPNTEYWIQVTGASEDTLTYAQCGFNITVGGPGADIVNVDFDAGPDAQVAQGGSTQLHATGGTTYDWSPTSGLSGNTIPDPIAQPNESTVYTVTTTLNGCTYSDTVHVDVVRLIDPVNTFTPNGDGINDSWTIPGIATYPQADVNIYDRWGQRVFHSVGYHSPFDGGNLPSATYYWYIQLNSLKGKSDPYTGYVTIVR